MVSRQSWGWSEGSRARVRFVVWVGVVVRMGFALLLGRLFVRRVFVRMNPA